MPNTLFVWDFHGVLEKDNEKAVIDISNRVLAESGFSERFTNEDNDKLYGLKWYQYFEHLLPNLSKEECLRLQSNCFNLTEKDPTILASHIKPNDHVVEILSKIAKSNSQQIVISNTRQNDLFWFLDAISVRDYFDDNNVIGVNAHQTHGSKIDALKDFLKDKKFEKIVAIGDSEGDLKLGKEVGAITYFYKHPKRNHEETQNADYIINDLREVLKELQ